MLLKKYICLSLTSLLLVASHNVYGATINHKKNDGLFLLTNEAGTLINASYVGWHQGWKWDAPIVRPQHTDTDHYKFNLEFRKQGVKSRVEIESNENSIKYSYYNQFNKSLRNTIGGGIEFTLDFQAQKRYSGANEPILLPDNRGWSWEFKSGKTIEVRFSPRIAKVYFEKGNKSRIRAMFFGGALSLGTSQMTMRVTVNDGSLVAPLSDLKQTRQHASWIDKALNPIKSFIDLSVLNEKPAGSHGFVSSVNDHYEFEDGTPVRFFGTNVQAYSLFIKNKTLIKQHAKRISSLGFNLVRLHHHDSPWVSPSLIKKGVTTQEINEKALDGYFWWVKCLRDEGVYVWVDLQVERPWREGDKVPGWGTDMASKTYKGMNVGKGFVYLNKRMQQLTKKFNTELLTRVNPYTKLALKDDPAVMGVMITNENDLTQHFGNTFLKDKNHPYHQRLFDKEVDAFADKFNLPPYKVRETWKPGYSKYLLNDLEASFNQKMIKQLKELGVKVPIVTTSLWGSNSALFSLPALTIGDVVDAHSYANSGIFKKSPLQKDPHYTPNFLHALGQGQVAAKPFTVTEYNVSQKNDLDNAFIPTVSVAAMAAFQGWDATMLYGYSQDGLSGSRASPWSSYTHPAIMGVVPAMALLYRQKHVAPANKTVVLTPANDELFTKYLSPKNSVTIRTTLEQHRMVVAMPNTKYLPWLKPSVINKDAIVIRDLTKDMLPANQDYIESDTKEIKRNWRTGIMTVNTPKSQLAMGRIGGHEIKLNNVVIKSKTPNAAIIFTSLDNKPIKKSEKILVSVVARVAKVKVKWKSAYISEPVSAKLSLLSMHNGLRLTAVHSDGNEGESRLLIKGVDGRYSFSISEKDKTHWYIISK